MKRVVLEAAGLLHGSLSPALEMALLRQPRVLHAEANALSGSPDLVP